MLVANTLECGSSFPLCSRTMVKEPLKRITVPWRIVVYAPVRFALLGTLPPSSCCALVELICMRGAILPNHFASGSRLGVGNFPKCKAKSGKSIMQPMRRSTQPLRSSRMTGWTIPSWKCTAGTVVGESSNHPTFSKTLAAKPVSTAHIPELDPKLRKSTSKGNILRWYCLLPICAILTLLSRRLAEPWSAAASPSSCLCRAEEESGIPSALWWGAWAHLRQARHRFKPLKMEPSTACHIDLPGQPKLKNVSDKPQVWMCLSTTIPSWHLNCAGSRHLFLVNVHPATWRRIGKTI